MMPLENELSSRAISGLAWSVQRRHGPLPLSVVFDEKTTALFSPGTKTDDLLRPENFEKSHSIVKLSALREPYRREILEETRAFVGQDLDRMERVVRRGATFYMTPEGRYSVDGRIGDIKGVYDRLAPHATVYLAGVSYDPFVAKRLSLLCRFARLDDRAHLKETLAALRPVTTSQLLGAWLEDRSEPFTAGDAVEGVTQRLRALPPQLFVDPELRRNPARMVRKALPLMAQWGILVQEAGTYRVAETRLHPQFPQVKDMIAYQARFLEESIANAAYSTITVVA